MSVQSTISPGTLPVYRYDDGDAVEAAVVLVHGFPLDHRMWDPVGDLVADALKTAVTPSGVPVAVLSVDLPGLGAAELPPGVPSLAVSAERLVATLAAYGVQRAVLAGMSMGGYVLLELARRWPGPPGSPDLLCALALVDTKDWPDDEESRARRLAIAAEVESAGTTEAVRGMAEAQLSPASLAEPARLAQVQRWIAEQPARGVAWSQRAMAARPDYSGVLAGLRVPVSIVVGEDDRLTTLGLTQEMASRAGDSALSVIARGGHLTAWENPTAVAAVLTRLVARSGLLVEDAS